MTNVEALKKLAVKVTGASLVPGSTIAEVISYMADNYDGVTPLAELTVTSVAGSTIDYTKITVTPALAEGDSYVYKTQATEITAPVYGEDLRDWTAWDGTSELEAEDRHYIYVAEINAEKKAVAGGITRISVKLG